MLENGAAMNFGVMFANVGPYGEPDGAAGSATIGEECGVESMWTVEHVVVPAGLRVGVPVLAHGRMPGTSRVPIPDPLMWLAWVGRRTRRTLRLATGILILPQRNPVILAKELATLDGLSGGRVSSESGWVG